MIADFPEKDCTPKSSEIPGFSKLMTLPFSTHGSKWLLELQSFHQPSRQQEEGKGEERHAPSSL